MKATQNEVGQRFKKRRARIVTVILILLIPIFFTGFLVGKSYAVKGKDTAQDVVEKVELPSKQDEVQEDASKTNKEQDQDGDGDGDEEIANDVEKEEQPVGKVVYLTFDDGPSKLTDQFLDVLQEQGVKATFFMQGSNLKKEHLQESVRRATAEGHYIGAHSMTHEFKSLYKENQFVPQMNETLALIHDITGTKPNLVRPPYGSAPGLKNEQIRNEIANAHIKVWDWTIDSNDWTLKGNPNQIIENIKRGTKSDREIVLMHEKPQTLAALPEIIAFYKAQGYTFAVYDEAHHFMNNFLKDDRL